MCYSLYKAVLYVRISEWIIQILFIGMFLWKNVYTLALIIVRVVCICMWRESKLTANVWCWNILKDAWKLSLRSLKRQHTWLHQRRLGPLWMQLTLDDTWTSEHTWDSHYFIVHTRAYLNMCLLCCCYSISHHLQPHWCWGQTRGNKQTKDTFINVLGITICVVWCSIKEFWVEQSEGTHHWTENYDGSAFMLHSYEIVSLLSHLYI